MTRDKRIRKLEIQLFSLAKRAAREEFQSHETFMREWRTHASMKLKLWGRK
jgi:hypothetical protein